MNKLNYIQHMVASILTILLLTQCGGGTMDDPRAIRAMEIVQDAIVVGGLSGEIDLEMKIDPGLSAGPSGAVVEGTKGKGGDLNREAFMVELSGSKLTIIGAGPGGLLYGSIKAAGMIRETGAAGVGAAGVEGNTGRNAGGRAAGLRVFESPQMNLRGIGLLLMKLGTYNYPVTPGEFPFFYDRQQWIDYLDFLEINRYNYIAFWNGHPFSYFVDLPEYPEAQDGMPEGLIQRNNEQLHWLISEAGKRNIRIFFEFYNIHTSVYFQEYHQLTDWIREPSPLLAGYTSYSIEQFCREFPEAGLYITAGEGLNPEHADEWVNDVIMPAIKRSGSNPPVLLRSWFLELEHAEKITRKHPEVYIERKFNVEMIADTRIDPAYETWDKLTGRSVVNIHMAANLEPFRWNPPEYIRECMLNSFEAGADGIHLYPRKSWRWPYGCDLGDTSVQWERDRLWYEMWARYSWDPQREPEDEKRYWIRRWTEETGSEEASRLMLDAFELSADILPAIQRLFWAGDDNHTVVTAGVLVFQIESALGIPFLSLDPVIPVWEYLNTPEGIFEPGRITPDSVLRMKISEAERAISKMDRSISLANNEAQWMYSYRQDMEAMLLTARFYRQKLDAVMYRNKFMNESGVVEYRDAFLQSLRKSVEIFRELCDLTSKGYESLSDVPAITPVKLEKCPYHWNDLLPIYENEFRIYKDLIQQIGGKDFNKPEYKGLAGVWYGDPGLKRPKLRFKTEKLEYNWDTDEKKPEGGRNWSVEWYGYIEGPTDGEVKFIAEADQVLKVKIGDKTVIDRSKTEGSPEGSFTMEKGEFYTIEIVYDHAKAVPGHVSLLWDFPNGGAGTIEGKYFSHSRAEIFRMDRMLIQPGNLIEN